MHLALRSGLTDISNDKNCTLACGVKAININLEMSGFRSIHLGQPNYLGSTSWHVWFWSSTDPSTSGWVESSLESSYLWFSCSMVCIMFWFIFKHLSYFSYHDSFVLQTILYFWFSRLNVYSFSVVKNSVILKWYIVFLFLFFNSILSFKIKYVAFNSELFHIRTVLYTILYSYIF